MEIKSDIKQIKANDLGLTIGNFDGLHIGHQKFLDEFVIDCKKNNLQSVVVTFVPHSRQVLRPSTNFLINSYKERQNLIAQRKVDFLLEIPFSRDLSTLNPSQFLDKYIFINNNVKKLYFGHDFVFGANKSGDFDFIKSYATKKKVDFFIEEEFLHQGIRISSSLIRSLIKIGDMKKVRAFLGHPFYVKGPVIKGAGRGKKIGVPTANIICPAELISPSNGVYVTKTLCQNIFYRSITNIGTNPTFEKGKIINIETNIFDFNQDIYGEMITVYFFEKIRKEEKFSSINDLVAQIDRDIILAKDFFIHD